MIRVANREDVTQLEILYKESFYQELPKPINWALKQVPERVLVVEEKHEILAAAYIISGYDHLWAVYLVFRQIAAAKNLIGHLIDVGKDKDIKNLYVFCHRKFVDLRLYLVAHGFVQGKKNTKKNYFSDSLEEGEGIFARRYEIAEQVAELALKCWKGKFDVGSAKVKGNSQTVFGFMFPFPLCPYWATSRVNKRFQGPPNSKHCDRQDKEVSVEACWACWNKGMKEKVENDSLWDSWRNSREYQELRVFLDQFDFDENMEWLRARNSRSVAALNKQAERRDRKRGSNT